MPTVTAIPLPAADSPSLALSSTSILSPEDKLEILTRALDLPKVTVNAIRFLRHALEAERPLLSFSDSQIAAAADCSNRTASTIRSWLMHHKLLSIYNLENLRALNATNCVMDVIESLKTIEEKQNPSPLHVANFCVDVDNSSADLARWLLDDFNFYRFPITEKISIPCRNRDERIDSWIWNRENDVLYACWLASSPKRKIKSKAGFVRAFIDDGRKAPAGWVHPKLLEKQSQGVEVRTEAPAAELSTPPPPMPQSDPELLPFFDWIEARVRPQSYKVWFEPAALVINDAGAVQFIHTIDLSVSFIADNYAKLINDGLQEVLGREVEVEFRVHR